MLINKSKDILDKTDPSEMKKYIMPAKEIKEIKLQGQEIFKEQQTKKLAYIKSHNNTIYLSY